MTLNSSDYDKARNTAKKWAKLTKKGIEKAAIITKKNRYRLAKHIRRSLVSALISGSSVGYISHCSTKNAYEKNTNPTEIQQKNDTLTQKSDFNLLLEQDNKNKASWWEKLKNGAEIKEDKGMYFYKVKKGETLSEIRLKLAEDPRFAYLKDSTYELNDSVRNLKSFNIGAKDLKAGLYIPIPVKKEMREFSLHDFYLQSLQAVDEMKNHRIYGDSIKTLLKSISREELAKNMVAFARSESTTTQSESNSPIGEVELHRREPHIWAFSFSHYHILMGKGQPGLKARIKLRISEGETYDPKNWWKLFLAYWLEKIATLKKENQKPLSYYLKIENWEKAKIVGRIYNGSEDYGDKLWKNLQLCQQNLKNK